jgi:hypothetical protein
MYSLDTKENCQFDADARLALRKQNSNPDPVRHVTIHSQESKTWFKQRVGWRHTGNVLTL